MDLDDEVDGKTPTDTSAIARRARRPTPWAALAVAVVVLAVIALIAVSRVGTGTNGSHPVTRQAALDANSTPQSTTLGALPQPPDTAVAR